MLRRDLFSLAVLWHVLLLSFIRAPREVTARTHKINTNKRKKNTWHQHEKLVEKTMFSKGKSGAKLLENNLILHHFDVGRLYASGGPEGVWKIYEGFSKNDGKVSYLESKSKNMLTEMDI